MTNYEAVDPATEPVETSARLAVSVATMGWLVVGWPALPVAAFVLATLAMGLGFLGVFKLHRPRRERAIGQVALTSGVLAMVASVAVQIRPTGVPIAIVLVLTATAPGLVWFGLWGSDTEPLLEAARGMAITAVAAVVLALTLALPGTLTAVVLGETDPLTARLTVLLCTGLFLGGLIAWRRLQRWQSQITPTDLIDGAIGSVGIFPVVLVSLVLPVVDPSVVPKGSLSAIIEPESVVPTVAMLVTSAMALCAGVLVIGGILKALEVVRTPETAAIRFGSGILFGGAILAGIVGAETIVVGIVVACSILTWSFGWTALDLGTIVGQRPATREVEYRSAGTAVVIAIGSVALAVLGDRVASSIGELGEATVAVVVVLGLSVFVVYPTLRA